MVSILLNLSFLETAKKLSLIRSTHDAIFAECARHASSFLQSSENKYGSGDTNEGG